MPGSSWTVVKFNDENSVEAVPTSWIFNKRCYWPPFQRDKVVVAIRKNEEPNTHWPSYEVTIFRNSTYGIYHSLFFIYNEIFGIESISYCSYNNVSLILELFLCKNVNLLFRVF